MKNYLVCVFNGLTIDDEKNRNKSLILHVHIFWNKNAETSFWNGRSTWFEVRTRVTVNQCNFLYSYLLCFLHLLAFNQNLFPVISQPWSNYSTTEKIYVLKIYLLYSGDVDGRVPFIGSRYCVEALGLPVKSQWQPWYLNNQVIIALCLIVSSP
jgi:hypothetical protein